jgi:2,4-dienoyl-CoA reductase-like NADH-dependent reductase (Old Yellow Enzyme family)
MAPLTRLRADEHHLPQPISVKYYEQRASVTGTFIISESTQVSLDGGGGGHAPGIFTDAQIQAWRRITDAVHARGSFIFLQLVALGRAADPQTLRLETGSEVSGPSPIPMKEGDNVPKALTEEQIHSLVRDFATAAKSAIVAGFDGVEVHGANG